MLSGKLQIVILIAVLIYFIVLFSLLKKKMLSLKYTLLWLLSGGIMLIIALFPGLLGVLTEAIGIQVPTNALFAILSFCGIIIMITLTAIVSKQSERIKRLTQSVAMMEKRIRKMERESSTEKLAEEESVEM